MLFSRISDILGGGEVLQRKLNTRLDLIELGRGGVSKDALLHLANFLKLSVRQIAMLLPITERTVQRYSRGKRFNRVVSEHILQIAEIAARGVEVFGDKNSFISWVKHPNVALANCSPMSLLSSRFGAEMVLDELGRIEHGIIS